jgi:uncharacterized protein YktA (UPF0223 family)
LKGDQVKKIAWFFGIGIVYFSLFILPNLKGAQNAAMVAVFEIDEYAQYPHLVEMLIPGSTFYQTIRNFLIYNHYFYGYPFYFFSALSVLPIKLIEGAAWPASTPVIMATLRQMISVLPMMLAIFLLVKMQTRLRPLWKAAGLFVFLLIVPAVVGNNLWWHPDSVAMLACVTVVYFLHRDDLRFGKNFFIGAAACGLAAGLKLSGLFFFAAVPLYLIWGLVEQKINVRWMLMMAVAFVGLMAVGLVISNPLLLFPQERVEVIKALTMQFQQTSQGIFFYQKVSDKFLNSFDENFFMNFGNPLFLVSLILNLLFQLTLPVLRKNNRQLRLQAIILAWIIPVMLTVDSAASRRAHYYLLVMIPLMSMLGGLPFEEIKNLLKGKPLNRLAAAGLMLSAGLVVFQAAQYVKVDVAYYREALTKEETSASIAFFHTLDSEYLQKIKADKLVIYRDWRIYFPSRPDREIEMSWDLASYDFIRPIHPDLILLERVNVNLFSNPESVEKAIDRDKSLQNYTFYKDALENRIEGYTLLYEDNFGLAFVKTNLWR